MLGTILSIVGGIADVVGIYKFGSTLAKGGDTERVLGALDQLHAKVERLSDHILYAPGVAGLSDTTRAARRLDNLRDVRELLEPVQVVPGGEIVSSGLIATPEQTERAMVANPWAVLEDIRPQRGAAEGRRASPARRCLCPSPSGRRWRAAPDEGCALSFDPRGIAALTRPFGPPSPSGRGEIARLS